MWRDAAVVALLTISLTGVIMSIYASLPGFMVMFSILFVISMYMGSPNREEEAGAREKVLLAFSGRKTFSTLMTETGLKRSTLAHTLSKLEEEGYVQRTTNKIWVPNPKMAFILPKSPIIKLLFFIKFLSLQLLTLMGERLLYVKANRIEEKIAQKI